MSLDDDLDAFAHAHTRPDPSPTEASELVSRAGARRGPGVIAIPLAAGSAAFSVIVAVVLLLLPGSDPPAEITEIARPIEATPVALSAGVHALGPDTFEVSDRGALTWFEHADQTAVTLQRGAVTVHAATRKPGHALVVHHQEYEVRVVGTRFIVDSDPFIVEVFEGQVALTGPGVDTLLMAGDHYQAPGTAEPEVRTETRPPPPVKPTLVPLDALTKDILEGRLDAARDGLDARITHDPEDWTSWRLLAQLEARSGRPDRAVEAWRAIADGAEGGLAQRARFELAVLLADEPDRVVPLLEAVVADPGPLGPEAWLHLGQARSASGDAEGADQAWRSVLELHPGTRAADKARSLLAE